MRRPDALGLSRGAKRAQSLKIIAGYLAVFSASTIALFAGACGDPSGTNGTGGMGGAASTSGSGQGGEGLGDFVTSSGTTSGTGSASSGASSSSGGPSCNAPDPAGGATTFAQRWGDAASQSGSSVQVDKSGNILLAGGFEGSIDFGNGAMPSGGKSDIYIAKLNPSGQPMWAKRFGDGYNQAATGIAADAAGNVYVTGIFIGNVDFGGGVLTSDTIFFQDIFLVKFGPDGSHQWSKRFGDKNIQYAQAIAVDASGNIVIGGYFQYDVDFGGGILSSSGGATFDGFVAKFNSAGQHLWSKRAGDAPDQYVRSVAMDASGNVYASGEASGSVDFGAGAVTATGTPSAFVAKLDTNGGSVWTKVSAGAANSKAVAQGVAVGPSGEVAAVGSFKGDFDFGGGKFLNFDLDDVFVTVFSSSGSHAYTRRFGDPSLQRADSAVFAPNGDVIVGGGFTGDLNLGAGPVTSLGGFDIFLARLDSKGCATWAHTYGGTMVQTISTMVLDPVGNRVLATGTLAGDTNLGMGTVTGNGDDAFVLGVKP